MFVSPDQSVFWDGISTQDAIHFFDSPKGNIPVRSIYEKAILALLDESDVVNLSKVWTYTSPSQKSLYDVLRWHGWIGNFIADGFSSWSNTQEARDLEAQALFPAAPIIACDADGKVLFANTAYRNLIQLPDDLSSDDISAVAQAARSLPIEEEIGKHALIEGESVGAELQLQEKIEGVRWIRTLWVPPHQIIKSPDDAKYPLNWTMMLGYNPDNTLAYRLYIAETIKKSSHLDNFSLSSLDSITLSKQVGFDVNRILRHAYQRKIESGKELSSVSGALLKTALQVGDIIHGLSLGPYPMLAVRHQDVKDRKEWDAPDEHFGDMRDPGVIHANPAFFALSGNATDVLVSLSRDPRDTEQLQAMKDSLLFNIAAPGHKEIEAGISARLRAGIKTPFEVATTILANFWTRDERLPISFKVLSISGIHDKSVEEGGHNGARSFLVGSQINKAYDKLGEL